MIDTLKGYIDLNKMNIPRHQIDRMKMAYECFRESGFRDKSNTVFRLWTKHNRLFIEGSLCKFFHQDNLNTLTRQEAALALDRLASELKLPIHDFIVTRIDFAENIKTFSKVETYIDAFEGIDKWKETTYSVKHDRRTGKLISKSDKALCLYNKILEYSFKQRYKSRDRYSINKDIESAVNPELDFEQENWLRVELRLTKNVGKQLIGRQITIGEIITDEVYKKLVQRWFITICSITYKNTILPSLDDVCGIGEFKKILMLGGIDYFGGYSKVMKRIRGIFSTNSAENSRKKSLVRFIKSTRDTESFDSIGKNLFLEVRKKAMLLALFHLGNRKAPSFKCIPRFKNSSNLN